MVDTLLVLTGFGIPLYSARGLTQSLDPIQGAGDFERDVNGNLVDLSPQQFKKYKSIISCQDIEAPAFDGVPIGTEVTVDCIRELPYLTASGEPSRPVVEDSAHVIGDWTYYRPRLTMLVIDFSSSQDEYAHTTSWQLNLEEV